MKEQIKRVVVFFQVGMSFLYPSFYEAHEQGWFWYQDPEIKEDDEEQKPEILKEPKENKHPAVKELESYKQSLEEKKAMSLNNPTYKNVQNYMFAQKEMMDRSENFSKMWKYVVLKTPSLNPEITFPTAQYLRHVEEGERQKERETLLKEASRKYGLFYFVSEGCAYCEAFSPIVKRFAENYGFNVMVVVVNGRIPPDLKDQFLNTQMNNGMAEAFGVEQAPALLAFDASTQDVIPVSFGATSLDTLENNFVTLLKD